MILKPLSPLQELEAALQCKYVAVEASKALAQVFHEIMEQQPSEVWAALRWAKILHEAPLKRPVEACDVLERAAVRAAQPGKFCHAKFRQQYSLSTPSEDQEIRKIEGHLGQ